MLQANLVSPYVLALSLLQGAYTLDINSSGKLIGCAQLSEHPKRHNKPVGYGSGSFNHARRFYNSTHQESLSIACNVVLQLQTPHGSHSAVYTDNDGPKV